MLPTSDLCLSFIGDDGTTERLFTVSSKAESPAVTVHTILADSSGRSFHINIADARDYFFWSSEKSKLLGIELIAKVCYWSCMYMTLHWFKKLIWLYKFEFSC